MKIGRCLVLALLAGPSVLAQSPRAEFEVASIHLSSPATSNGGVRIDGSQVHYAGFPFREYVARAYRIRLSHVLGPDWMNSVRFDLDAKLPEGATPAQIPQMLQALLSDRFGLKQHREQKEMPMYALMLGKPPLRLTEIPRDADAKGRDEALVNVKVEIGAAGTSVDLGYGSSYTLAGGKFEGKRMSAEVLASTLERYCDRPVVNMTGLSGVYDLVFEMSPEDSQVIGIRAAVNAGVRLPPQAMSLLDSGGNPLVVAVEQLGLKLDARKAPVDVLVVDDARRTPVDN